MTTLIYGLQVAALGIGVVFSVLIFLILVIFVMSKIVGSGIKKPADKLDLVNKNDIIQVAPVPAEDDSELLAVIAAAVACMTQGNQRITTIRRISAESVPVWSASGRQEIMSRRQIL